MASSHNAADVRLIGMSDLAQQKSKIFISYSRRDSSDFAEELLAGLQLAGFAPFLDRHDIAAGEEWEARLGSLIQQADTVVYVISPEAVRSPRCAWEVSKAIADSKRVLPIIFVSVPEADIPPDLQRRQFIRFDNGHGITRPLAHLAEAIRQDIDWIREHTRFGELAQRWNDRGRPESMLLRSEELTAARRWSEDRKSDAPMITENMRAFIVASADAEAAMLAKSTATSRRIIRMQVFLLVLLSSVIIGLLGWINQSYIVQKWNWYAKMRPYMIANVRPYVLTATFESALQPGMVFRECKQNCPEMIVVPPGQFLMGSPADEPEHLDLESPQHVITIAKPFAVAKYDVTFDDWDVCYTVGGCPLLKDGGTGRGRQPVVNVSWYDAKAYVSWLSQMTSKTYRLLSEAEWEYAARGGTTTAHYWGESIADGAPYCRGCEGGPSLQRSLPVGSLKPNGFGLYDMEGNVWQWVEDCNHDNYNGAPINGAPWNDGECDLRVSRGGASNHNPRPPRIAVRVRRPADNKVSNIGFRIARTLTLEANNSKP